MTSPSHTDLREELSALAETQSFSPDPSAWDRGRRARRRSRVVRAAAAVAVVGVVVSAGAIAVRPDPVGPAGGVAREGAIPSVIPEGDGQPLTDLAIGRASVAYVDAAGVPVLVDAETGEANRVELPDFPEQNVLELMGDHLTGPLLAVSPDGRRIAYPATSGMEREPGRQTFTTAWYRVVDLTTGEAELVDTPSGTGTPRAMSWTADGQLAVDLYGRSTAENIQPPVEAWTIDPETGDSSTSALTGVTAPGGGISAPYPLDDEPVAAVPFETSTGSDPSRDLPADLYPDGAVVTPIGWADNSLLVAQVDAPAGSYVEGEHLVLLTSPDRPESEWTYRILVRDVPTSSSLSLAVDLIPDLDGTSAQELTHDFSASPVDERDISWMIGLGVAAAIAVLMGLRWLWRRFLP
ncbi:hypothetical protein SAMN05192575_105142 [Nocardioides alpinus]|uniref:Uncharacterized protein n=1 Tax=Nocardioides alpinus TaxID=748909 RepID=A0A1I0Z9S9_9ACTN|nr:hypothetical protein [Nocardioides alpinus]PKH40757.1 hypothetical protein CXG46_12295 [Nocardioides alpinus]SFB22162.1 hypothetical protein SAMN05192575_105142 [Nocardioides alpinus]